MPFPWEGFLGIGALIALIIIGVPVFLSLFAVGIIGYSFLVGINGLTLLQLVPYRETATFVLTVLPLFILMGAMASYGAVAKDAFRAAYAWVGHLRGGLGVAAIATDVIFAATSSSSMAATATVGAACIPEMKKYGYAPAVSAGLIACGGTMASLIPPATTLIIYGVFTDTSIGALLLGAYVPGLLQATMYIAGIYLITRFRPKLMPAGPRSSWKERFTSLPGVLPLMLIIALIMGGIYLGVFTPTEAAALGAFGMIILVTARRRLSRRNVSNALLQTGRVTSMAMMIIVGAMIFSYFLTRAGLPTYVIQWVAGLKVGPHLIMIVMLFMYVILGMLLPALPMIMLTLPVTFPLTMSLGVNPIVFGILLTIMCEISAITPPMALNLFVAHRLVPEVPFADICKGVLPFVTMDFARTLLILYFPVIVLIVPNTMRPLGQ